MTTTPRYSSEREILLDVVQRLARIETHIEALPERVTALERWKNITTTLAVAGLAMNSHLQNLIGPLLTLWKA